MTGPPPASGHERGATSPPPAVAWLAGPARRLARDALVRSRVWKYRALSTCEQVSGGTPIVHQPVLMTGPGAIVLGTDVEFGWPLSDGFYSGYSLLDATTPDARIDIGDGAQINNGAFIKSEGAGIVFGPHALLGSGVVVLDSDFHELDPARRRGGRPQTAPVDIGANVFVGIRATILKGVTVGADSVIGAGSVVTTSIPAGVIAAGNPARIVRAL